MKKFSVVSFLFVVLLSTFLFGQMPSCKPDTTDTDTDGIIDTEDNCPNTANADQKDTDGDKIGDVCDNCLNAANADQKNSDTDTLGDACDNCPNVDNYDQKDADNDKVGDVCDNCPYKANADQKNSDMDTFGDVCDNCPNDTNEDQKDSNNNGKGDACDQSTCEPKKTSPGTGNHNAGKDCLSCHATLSGNLKFTVAGTLYNTVTGMAPVVGGTIVVTDSNNVVTKIVSANNGNFYTATAMKFPITVKASLCPDEIPMVSTVTNGSCNTCHGTTARIHIP
jgi:hypothetical protein